MDQQLDCNSPDSAGAFTLSAAILTNAWNALKDAGVTCHQDLGARHILQAGIGLIFVGHCRLIPIRLCVRFLSQTRDFSPTAFPRLSGWLTQTIGDYRARFGIRVAAGRWGQRNQASKKHFGGGNETTRQQTSHSRHIWLGPWIKCDQFDLSCPESGSTVARLGRSIILYCQSI